jgi:PAS domain S-box-containing protein
MDRSPVRGVARLAAILDSLPEALLLIDGAGRVVNANAVALGWFESGGVPLVGRSITEFLSGFGTAVARVADGGGVWTDSGYPDQSTASAGGPERMVAKTAAGAAFPAEIVRSFLPAAHGGLEVVCVRDVSGVADAEQELRRQQRQTELILRATSEGIVGVDTVGRVVLVNPAAARILKYRASELGGLEFASFISGESPVADTLRTGRKHRLGVEAGIVLTAKDGTRVPVELSTAPVLEGEALVGAVVTFVDVSRFRLPVVANGGAAGQTPAGGALNADSVSALRRPLDAARGELARLADGGEGLSPNVRHHLAHVTAELAEAARMVDDLLDAATGLSGLRKRPAELGRIVHAAVDAATDLAAAAGIDLAVHTGPAEVVIDAERLTQALRHLLVDTVQASPHGSTVVVAAARRGPIARIEIRGVEIGSVPEHLGFARVVVERHGGQLSVHRVEGKGVTYVIELPAGTPHDSELMAGGQGGAAAAMGSMNRPLVEETRIIPIVREIEPADAGPRGATAQRGRQIGGVQIGAGAQAPAAGPAIPRQADAADEQWYDGVRGYAATGLGERDRERERGERGGNTESEAGASPRGRRRAAGQQATATLPAQQGQGQGPVQGTGSGGGADGYLTGGVSYQQVGGFAAATPEDSYLIQHVQPPFGPEQAYAGDAGFGGQQEYGPQQQQQDWTNASDAGQQYGTATGFGGRAAQVDPLSESQMNNVQGVHQSAADPRQQYGTGQGFGAPVGQSGPNALNQGFAPVGQSGPNPLNQPSTLHQPSQPLGAPQAEPRAWPNPDEPDPEPVGAGDAFGWSAAGLATGVPGADATTQPTLLVWPAPEPNAAELLLAQGYAPTALKAPSQLAETGLRRPVALLADPVGVPVTRAALHTLRAAAADSGIPLFVTAGLGAVPAAALAATARRGADPSALLRALTPEQIAAPRVLLIEENPDLAAAFAISLERDGMRVVQAASENDAMAALSAEHPQLVVMNLTLVRRRRSGVVDWLRAYERLHLAPTVLYTAPAALIGDLEMMRGLRSGAAAVHLTDRETHTEAANRLLDLMGKVAD